MSLYAYSAMDAKGKERKGVIEAESENIAGNKLRQEGLFPTSITLSKNKPSASAQTKPKKQHSFSSSAFTFGAPRMKRKRLTEFTRQLSTLLDAGMPIVRGLRTLEEQASDMVDRIVISKIAESVEGGRTLSEAMAVHPKTFNHLYVNMIRAGEVSGSMEQVLARLADHMEKAARLKAKVKSAMTYPISVMIIAVLITAGLMYFIIPRFEKMFRDMLAGEPLPAVTELVIGISNAIKNHFVVTSIIIGLIAFAFIMFKRTRAGSYFIDYVLIKAPPFGTLTTKAAVARFCATLGTLLQSGVPVLNALNITKDTSGNAVVSDAVQKVSNAVREGEGMALPLKSTAVFPKMVTGMIEIGEETGALPDMLGRVARVYEDEVDLAVDSLTSLIEPVMIVVLGVLIGTIVFAMFMPIIIIIQRI